MTKRKPKKSTRKKSAHEKLGITFAELGALYGTRSLLAQGVLTGTDECLIKHNIDNILQTDEIKDGVHRFNMNVAAKGQACASISCIGGTMALIMGKTIHEATVYVGNYAARYNGKEWDCRSPALHALFFPEIDDVRWARIQPEEAIEAIDNFLGGNTTAPWKDVEPWES